MKKCHECGGKLEKAIELIENEPVHTFKCVKCGESIASLDEYDRVRKKLHPKFSERLKSLFQLGHNPSPDLFKGKIL